MSDANAYVLVYDLLNPDSFEYISNVYSALHEARELSHLPIMVVGNKTDKVRFNSPF
jgi:GTPase SAR1 family protein